MIQNVTYSDTKKIKELDKPLSYRSSGNLFSSAIILLSERGNEYGTDNIPVARSALPDIEAGSEKQRIVSKCVCDQFAVGYGKGFICGRRE